MGMDALTNATIDSLLQDALERVRVCLEKISAVPADEREPSPELTTAVKEAMDLLSLVAQWSGAEVPAPVEEMDDADAARMLAEMDAPPEAAPSGEINDADAARMLAEMDAPPEAAPSGEMDDADAARMLAEMDAPPEAAPAGEMDDADAARMLAEMDAPPEAAPAGEMDDADAARMLAEMDAPPEAAPAGEMDDADAARMLAEMDAPSEAAQTDVVAATEAPATDDLHEIDEWEANDFQSDADMMADFLNNCDELMENLDDSILQLEQSPDDKAVVEEIFRAAHTLKGAAGMFGFRALERVMHRMENLFDLCRKGKMTPNADIVDVLFSGMDIIRSLLDAVRNGAPCGIETVPIVRALEQVANGQTPTKVKKADAPAEPESADQPAKEAVSPEGAQNKPADEKRAGGQAKAAKKNENSTIRVDLHRLDALVNLIGELVIDRTRFNHIEEELRMMTPQSELVSDMAETVQLFGRHMNEIQDIIMKVRMVPIGNAFNKFPRIVRDLARSLGKEIDLAISGESAELDKTLVEQLGDPLIHLIRNSCDHGVELPEIRESKGKPGKGTIKLGARQEGNHIVVTIEDDGKGLDKEGIRQKGIERGLISADDQLSDRDIFNLIFESGFSTASQVTEVSGRGVGMDVVKRQISKLKGMIELSSQPGVGTVTTIQLPLTLAIVQSLLVSSHGETYAIPLSSVVESIRIHPDAVQKVGDSEVIKLRDHVLPLIHLNDTLMLHHRDGTLPELIRERDVTSESAAFRERQARRRQERLYVVVVGSADRRYGIVVDQLLNQQEMVIKSMGPLVRNIPCVAGGAVLGQGEVVLVLDVGEIVDTFYQKIRGQQIA